MKQFLRSTPSSKTNKPLIRWHILRSQDDRIASNQHCSTVMSRAIGRIVGFSVLHVHQGVRQISQALEPLTPAEKLVFWKRPHGALGARTVGKALCDTDAPEQLQRVTQLAQAWALEAHPGGHAASA